MYPAYQCLKTVDRTVYCSRNMVNNHAEGSAWAGRVIQQYGLNANDIHGRPYTSNNIPRGAIIVD